MRLQQLDQPDTAMHRLQQGFVLIRRNLVPLAIGLSLLKSLDEQWDLIMQSDKELRRLLCAR